MAAEKASINFLKRQIESYMVRSESGRYFLPRQYIGLIFTLDKIEKAVGELDCPIDEKIGLSREIYERGARVFATLIKNGEENLITRFRKYEVLGHESPLDEVLARRIMGDFGVAFAREYQWQFLPYIFRRNMRDYHRDIHEAMILPFIGEPDVIASGAFGDVSQMEISPFQQEFVPNSVSQYEH